MATDNRDLANERQRRGLSQQDIADLLSGEEMGSGRGFNFSNVSRFETADKLMPPRRRGEPRQGRAEYQRALDEYDRSQS